MRQKVLTFFPPFQVFFPPLLLFSFLPGTLFAFPAAVFIYWIAAARQSAKSKVRCRGGWSAKKNAKWREKVSV